jgi:hypothetical protein
MCRRPRPCVRVRVGVTYFRTEPVVKDRRRARRYFAGATICVQALDFRERTGISFQREVASGLARLFCNNRRLWVTLLDREHQSRENHGAQKSCRKPHRIAIESSDHDTCAG